MGNCWMEKYEFLFLLVSACCIDVGGHWCVILGLEMFLESFDSFVLSFCSYHDRYIEDMKY